MPPFSTQVRLFRAIGEILLGDAKAALPRGNQPKPDFNPQPVPVPLPRSTPEAEGLSSALLENLYRQVAATPKSNGHALLVLRHGKVVSEAYFSPYRKGVWHVTHSLCKTITGMAVGIAIHEGLFGLDDTVADYFLKESGLITSKAHRTITVRHLLTMSSGISFNEVSEAVHPDWIRGIFSSPLAFAPGEKFAYNSLNSYLLSALVCKTSGLSLVEYLTPRLFAPLGFGPVAWEKSPEGYEKGGWGMYLMVEDMAKLGQLYLQQGNWCHNGVSRQLVPTAWVQQATAHLIDSDRGIGYGHHCWVDSGNHGYIMNGMFGQYITVLPRQQIVVVMTAGNPNIFADSTAYQQVNAFFAGLGPLPQSLPPAPAATARLYSMLATSRFRSPYPQQALRPLPAARRRAANRYRQVLTAKTAPPPAAGFTPFCGTTWQFDRNRGGILPIVIQAMDNNFTSGLKAVYLEEMDGQLTLYWEEGKGTLVLPLGLGTSIERLIHVGRESFLVACSAHIRPNEDSAPVLIIDICFLEHSSFRRLKLRLQDDGKLLLHLDEEPQFMGLIESALKATGNDRPAGRPSAMGGLMRNSDYLHYRTLQVFMPTLLGTPVNESPIADSTLP